jgi:hypothetical protein
VRAYFLSFERSLMEETPDVASCLVRIKAGLDAFEQLAIEIQTVVEKQ